MTAGEIPERTGEQRTAALQVAREVRSWRSEVKGRVKARQLSVADVLRLDDERLETWKVADLLGAQPYWGKKRVAGFLRRAQISPTKTIGGLSTRQRAEVLALCSR